MTEIRWHGRGGQGAVASAEMLAIAAIEEGKSAQAFPSFGPERRGAPVMAFTRVSDEFIYLRTGVTDPDVVVVLDPTVMSAVDVTAGLKDGGLVVVNTSKSKKELAEEFGITAKLATVDADGIANEEIGRPITNTTMMGALVKAIGLVELDSLAKQIEKRFPGVAEKNVKAMRRAYEEADV
jgi:2-oxoacid:acceptor oxidoreductase gamma subunit (pyruvate/2-ketoisovalerate family)